VLIVIYLNSAECGGEPVNARALVGTTMRVLTAVHGEALGLIVVGMRPTALTTTTVTTIAVNQVRCAQGVMTLTVSGA
jgi:hypothetical protein